MNGLVTQGLGTNQKLVTSGFGYSNFVLKIPAPPGYAPGYSPIITQGLAVHQLLATSGYGISRHVVPEPPIIILPGPSVGTGGRTLTIPIIDKKTGTRFIVTTLLLNKSPSIRGRAEKFFFLKVVRVSTRLEEHEENNTEVRVSAHLWGTDWDA